MLERINLLVKKYYNRIVDIRRDLHQHPELSTEEVRTAGVIAQTLREIGLEVAENVGGFGVVGLLRGKEGGKTIALRADMDALPVMEQNCFSYASKQKGVMHACGHDAHVAILLGTAMVCQDLKSDLEGNVKFIFQPAEEGPGGAEPMISEGVLENPKVDAIAALHVYPDLDLGTIGLKEGVMSASTDEIKIEIIGKGGHGAYPHQGVDAIVVAAQVVTALQTIVSRRLPPHAPAVITIGTIQGGTRNNIIADMVEMTGTVRLLDPVIRENISAEIEKLIQGITSGLGAEYRFEYIKGYPSIINNRDVNQRLAKVAEAYLGRDKIEWIDHPTLGGEDFAYFCHEVPGAFFRLGTRRPGEKPHPLHHPCFCFDEKALATGVTVMVGLVVDYLLTDK